MFTAKANCAIIKAYLAGYAPSLSTDFDAYLKRKAVCGLTEVVAALIWDGGKFMICRRPKHKTRGMLWEFVGGKVEKGESPQEALIRECREELEISLKVGEVFMQVVHEYPDMTVRLTLFNAEIEQGTPILTEHSDLRWISPSEIPKYDFCPADVEILKKIRETSSCG